MLKYEEIYACCSNRSKKEKGITINLKHDIYFSEQGKQQIILTTLCAIHAWAEV